MRSLPGGFVLLGVGVDDTTHELTDHMPHLTRKATIVKPTERCAKSASMPKTGFFSALRGLLHAQGSGASSRSSRALAFLLATLLGSLAFAAVPAMAETIHAFSTSFAGAGEGAGELSSPAGEHSSPDGVAVNSTTHDIYVADTGNDRIDEFEADGNFVRAWGWGVAEGIIKKEEFQMCTLTCFKGLEGPKPGEFISPEFVAVDNSGGPSNGDVYVGDRGDNIVTKFSESGALIESWGTKGQLDGSTTTFGSFGYGIAGVAVDGSGTLMVLDRWEVEAANSIEGFLFRFTQGGAFSEELTLSRGVNELGLAVDSEGNFFKGIIENFAPIEEYTGSGSELGQVSPVRASLSATTTGLAVDSATGDLYVDVGGDVEAYAFSAAGIVSSQGGAQCRVSRNYGCPPSYTFGSSEPSGGSLSGASGIAVNSSSDDVYVADASAGRIDIFTPETVPDVTTEAPAGLSETAATLRGTVNPDETEVTDCKFEYGTERGVYPNTVACSQTLPLTGNSPVAVSAPPLSGLTAKTTYYYRLVATNANGANYAENSFTTFGTPTIESESSEDIGHTSATLKAQIDPNGPETHYHFEYGPNTSYGTSIPIPDGALAGGFAAETVSVNLTGLVAGATYHFRVAAVNAESPTPSYGPDKEFTTVAAAIVEETVSDVTATSATLNARVDPLGTDTSAYFQYGTVSCAASPASCTDLPVPPPGTDVGSEEGYQVLKSIHLQGLAPDTIYYYRVVATNALGIVEGELSEAGEEVIRTFTTQLSGSVFALPDGRQWEMVTPPNKHGALIEPIGYAGLIEAAAGGDAFTFLADAPTELEPRGYGNNFEQALSTRTAGGWSSQDIALRHNVATGVSIGEGDEYRFFSPDLSRALVEPQGEFTPLAGEETSPEATEGTPYERANVTCQATPTACYTPLVTEANTPPGTTIGRPQEGLGTKSSEVEFVGATPDLSHVVLYSHVALTSTPSGGGLYEWAAGQLQLVSVRPASEGGPTPDADFGIKGSGYQKSAGGNGVSVDGSRVIWSFHEDSLYMRDTVTEETVRLDLPEAECLKEGTCGSEPAEPHFKIASSDGSRVFFTDTQRLTADSRSPYNPGSEKNEPDLYVCQMVEVEEAGQKKLKCDLTDLSADTNPGGERADVQGVLDASEDGSYVYFAASGVLGDGAEHGATPGNCIGGRGASLGSGLCNLYVDHYSSEAGKWEVPHFIAAVSGADYDDWAYGLTNGTARSSPDGRYLAFMSQQALTGYNNLDAVSGEPDEEVYLYDALTHRLECASCNPTGARPLGEEFENQKDVGLSGGDGVWAGSTWLAANVPGWVSYEDQAGADQPRYLSDSGRLFFNSHEALVPEDVNGTWDVYEYEPPGIGTCTTAAVTFGERSGGCVGLISAGESPEESAFLDASESGGDVFFLTASQLVPQDFDHSLDVYDAHECTGVSPCFPTPAVQPPSCTTEASCKPSPTPQPTLYAPPPSATFNGPGNVTPEVAPPPKKVVIKKTVKCKKGYVKKKVKKQEECVKKPKKSKNNSAHKSAKARK